MQGSAHLSYQLHNSKWALNAGCTLIYLSLGNNIKAKDVYDIYAN